MTPIAITRATDVLPEAEVVALQPLIDEINWWKKERNAIVAAHNYMTPDIYHLAADIKGDSLALAQVAVETEADVIVLAGVHFMAETAKLINPEKMVLIPDLRAGCSLADGITGADVRALREQHPGAPVVTYVNTSAEVKAESDICCTSSNAVAVVESLGVDKVIFTPDRYLGMWVPARPMSRSSSGRGRASSMSGSPARRSPTIGAGPTGSRSSPIPSAHPTSWPKPTTSGRPTG